jgi:hypothetical protein
MHPIVDRWSIIIAGLWNPNIFSPEWIQRNLLSKAVSPSLEMAVGPAMIPQLRLLFGQIAITPSKTKLQLTPLEATDECLAEAERVALRVLQVLPHTPIRGYGVNLAFSSAALDSTLFNATDYPKLIKLGLEPVQRQITRNLKFSESCFLNLTIETGTLKDESSFSFNFHHNPKPDLTIDIDTVIDKALYYKNEALRILQDVYNVALEEENKENDSEN